MAFRGRVTIVEIFLDHNNLSWQRRQCPTMGEKFGLTFCSWLQSCPGKPYMWIFCLCFPYGELLRSENFSTMVTRRNGFSSLLFIPRLTYNLKLSKKVKNYQRMPSRLWETYFLIFVKMDVCGLEHSLYCSRLKKALWMKENRFRRKKPI